MPQLVEFNGFVSVRYGWKTDIRVAGLIVRFWPKAERLLSGAW
jgi:hypothetical protein